METIKIQSGGHVYEFPVDPLALSSDAETANTQMDELAALQAETERLRVKVAQLEHKETLINQAYWQFINADPGHVVEALENFQNVLRQEATNA